MAISSPDSRARPSGARPWCWPTMTRSGRMERSTGCRSASTDGRAFGPGIFDMKASLAMFLRVMELIERVGLEFPRPVWVLFTCDEEIGSPTSRSLIEELARVGLCLGARAGPGRRGVEDLAEGRGTIPSRGCREGRPRRSRSRERPQRRRRARPSDSCDSRTLQDLAAGTTINVGVIKGGTTPNVVPAVASAEIDVRVASKAEADSDRIGPPLARSDHARYSPHRERWYQQAPDGANSGRRVAVRASPAHRP